MARGFLLTAAGAAVFVIAGLRLLRSEYRYRYRLTVEVETPAGLKTGSAVEEQVVGKSNIDLGDLSAKRWIRTRGEAAAVDLPGGQTLFAVLPKSEVAQAVLDPEWRNDWVESARRITSGHTPRDAMPMSPGKPSDPRDKPAESPTSQRRFAPSTSGAGEPLSA